MQAEAYALQMAVEHGDRLRYLICELTGKIVDMKNWVEETDGARVLGHCQTAEAPRKVQDKRLGIALAALRQGVWTVNGEMTSKVYSPYGHHLKWIETAKSSA